MQAETNKLMNIYRYMDMQTKTEDAHSKNNRSRLEPNSFQSWDMNSEVTELATFGFDCSVSTLYSIFPYFAIK